MSLCLVAGDNQQSQVMSIDDMIADKSKDKDEKKMSPEIAVMQPILRLLQLLCENHNRDLQVGIHACSLLHAYWNYFSKLPT